MEQLKTWIKEYAELCNIKIKQIRKSKNSNVGYHVYGYNGESAFLYLMFFETRNYKMLQDDLHRGFNKPFPKVVRIS
jgi:hypothetical protein